MILSNNVSQNFDNARLASHPVVLIKRIDSFVPQVFAHEYPRVLRHKRIPIKKTNFVLIVWALIRCAICPETASLERLQKMTFTGAVKTREQTKIRKINRWKGIYGKV